MGTRSRGNIPGRDRIGINRSCVRTGSDSGPNNDQNVPGGYFSKNSQRTHNEAQFHRKPSKNSLNTHQIHFDHMVGAFEKTLKELTTSGSGTLQAHYKVIFERN